MTEETADGIQVPHAQLSPDALRGVVERYGLQGQRLDDVAAGAQSAHRPARR